MGKEETDHLPDKIANKVYDKISGTFMDFMTNIEEGQKNIIAEMKARSDVEGARVSILENKIKHLDVDNITKYREEAEKLHDEIKIVAPKLDKIVDAFKWWKVAIYVFATALVATLIVLSLHKGGYLSNYIKDRKFTTEWNQDVSTMDQRDKGITRGVPEVKRTDAEITANQERILKSIKPYKK
jgi:hypothetical protein